MGTEITRTPKESRLLLRNRDWMERAYDEHSSYEIGTYLGCGFSTVCQWLRRHGIPRRSLSEAQKMRSVRAADRSKGRNRQMVTAGVSDVHPRPTDKDWMGG